MTRVILGDLRTGRRILDLPVKALSWDDRLDTAETIRVTVNMRDPDAQALDLRHSAAEAKSFLGVVENGVIVAAGPIWTHDYDRDAGTLELGAKGLASIFDHRLILPLLAMTTSVSQWTIPDPADKTKTIPNPALSSVYTGLWLGTIAKRLVQQAMTYVGGNLPLVLPPDEASTNTDHDRTYIAADLKPIGEALQQLSGVEGGPEINFAPRFTTDQRGVEWVMQVGTGAQPLLFSRSVPTWNLTTAESPVTGFRISTDASTMGSLAWLLGGRQSDTVLVSRAYDSRLVDLGFPLLEITDTSHSTVDKQPTLDKWASQALIDGRGPVEIWEFKVKAFPIDDDGNQAGPQVGSYNVGDFCEVIVKPWDADTATGDPYYSEGGPAPRFAVRRRIVALSGDLSGTITIQTAPEVH